jgi:hypothetical protein
MRKLIKIVLRFLFHFVACWILVRLVETKNTVLQVTFQALFLAAVISLLVDRRGGVTDA